MDTVNHPKHTTSSESFTLSHLLVWHIPQTLSPIPTKSVLSMLHPNCTSLNNQCRYQLLVISQLIYESVSGIQDLIPKRSYPVPSSAKNCGNTTLLRKSFPLEGKNHMSSTCRKKRVKYKYTHTHRDPIITCGKGTTLTTKQDGKMKMPDQNI